MVALLLVACGSGGNGARGNDEWHTFVETTFGLSVRYPSSWHVTHDSLTEVVWPPDILAVSSYPLTQRKPDPNCAPVSARRDMPENGVFIYLFEHTGAVDSEGDYPDRPGHFELGEAVSLECFGLSHGISFGERGRAFQAIVAFGPAADVETRRVALAVLDSIEVTSAG